MFFHRRKYEKLSAEKLATLIEQFNELDKNGDGVLSKSEAVELLAQLDMFDEAQMASFWAGQADDDKINFQEFMEIQFGVVMDGAKTSEAEVASLSKYVLLFVCVFVGFV